MKHYTYRPPQMYASELSNSPKNTVTRNFLVSLFVLLGIGTGFQLFRQNTLISPLDAETTDASSLTHVASSLSTLSKIKPFLQKNPSNWKLQSGRPQQAVGGGDSLLKESLQMKGALSVNFSTGEVYYAAQSAARLPIASTTKIMTAMVALDLAKMDETFTVEEAATEVEPTVIGVRTGDKLTTRELLMGGLLTSGNDAMAVLAEGTGKKYGGNTSLFVQAMNAKAEYLGLKNTHFANPEGYDDPQHYSSCEDLAVMTHYALSNYPEIAKIVTMKDEHLKATDTHQNFYLPNWNMLIDTYPGADGVKIGNTGDAGHTTVASATRNGTRIIAVALGAEGILKRDLAAAELLNVGFQKEGIAPFEVSEDMLRKRVREWYE